mmetsp:Transcript_94688/g.244527  ORF Transcript_94688/g.244527 Transcript_94688/m.244527 type:complete len:314 (-) Transcript_94688:79-1020(-)
MHHESQPVSAICGTSWSETEICGTSESELNTEIRGGAMSDHVYGSFSSAPVACSEPSWRQSTPSSRGVPSASELAARLADRDRDAAGGGPSASREGWQLSSALLAVLPELALPPERALSMLVLPCLHFRLTAVAVTSPLMLAFHTFGCFRKRWTEVSTKSSLVLPSTTTWGCGKHSSLPLCSIATTTIPYSCLRLRLSSDLPLHSGSTMQRKTGRPATWMELCKSAVEVEPRYFWTRSKLSRSRPTQRKEPSSTSTSERNCQVMSGSSDSWMPTTCILNDCFISTSFNVPARSAGTRSLKRRMVFPSASCRWR